MCRADNSSPRSRTRPGSPPESFGIVIATPCCTSRLAIVRMSARSGRLLRTSGSSLKRLAAISGSAAFLAPPIWIVPDSGTPPRIRILSIVLAPASGDRPWRAATAAVLYRAGKFYGRGGRRSSRRLAGLARWLVRAGLLGWRGRAAGAGLLLAALQVVAQGLREARLARGMLQPLGADRAGRIGHRGHQKGSPTRAVNPRGQTFGRRRPAHSSTRRLTLAARITATACFAAYSADWSG